MRKPFFKRVRWFIPVVLIGIIVVGLLIISAYLPKEIEKPYARELIPQNAGIVEVTGVTWVKTFGGPAALGAAQPTSDGGGVVLWARVAGKTPYGGPFSVEYISKVDADGNLAWNKTFVVGWAGSVQQTSDNGYIMAGGIAKRKDGSDIVAGDFSKIGKASDSDVYLIKMDSDGNTVWNRTFDLREEQWCDGASSVQQTSDGYVIAGVTKPCYGEGGTAFLLKTDADGSRLFEKTVAFEGEPLWNTIVLQQTSDRGYMIAGFIEMNSTGAPRETHLIKTDADGNKIWERAYDNEFGGGRMISVIQTSDTGYTVVGQSSTSIYFLKTDANGNILDKKEQTKLGTAFCDGQLVGSVQQTSDRGYIIAKEGTCLVKTNVDGNMVWEKAGVVGTDFKVEDPWVWQTPDNGYMIVGKMYYGLTAGEIGQGMYSDIIMVKTDKNGNVQYEPIPARYPTSPVAPPAEKVTVTGKGWSKTFEGDFSSRANSVEQTSDGGYIVAGGKQPSDKDRKGTYTPEDAYLIKTDANGNV